MIKRICNLTGLAISLLGLATSASAEIKLNDNISTSGYIVGSNQYWSQITRPQNASYGATGIYKEDTLDVDAAKLQFDINYKPLSGAVSFYYTTSQQINLLDAYVTLDAGHGISVSGGKFQSWLGFEAFDAVNMYQISYANNDFLRALPTYHSGVRVEYSDQNCGAGIAVLDSVYSNYYYGNNLKGDGEFRYNQGFEAYFTYKGIKDLTLWSGIGYETRRTSEPAPLQYSYYPPAPAAPSIVTLDFWASYQLSKNTLVATEFVHKNGDAQGDRGYNWLVLTNHIFTEKFSTAFRISGEHVNSFIEPGNYVWQQPNFTKFTVAPSYNVTPHLTIRGEVSCYNYSNYRYFDKNAYSLPSIVPATRSLNHSTYIGVQALFKF
jgi:hypothetical protein